MNLITIGLNHTTAPLALRERVAFPPQQLAGAVAAARDCLLRADPERTGSEAAILSTCNRTELYAARSAGAAVEADIDAISRFLADYHGLAHAELRPHLYARVNGDAVRHAFRVAAGLDSMVLGEPQILGQMKDAVRHAEAGAGLGTYLHQLFQRAFSVAKDVRSKTAIGAHSMSMAAAAVRLAQRVFPTIEGRHVLLIGAGDMIELCAAHFAAQRPASITVANRGIERARLLAARHAGRAIALPELAQHLGACDIVISCTAATQPLLTADMVRGAPGAHPGRPVFMLDLAVPRDIAPEVGTLPGVHLSSVDDLAQLVQQGRERRQAAVAEGEAIIDDGVRAFMEWTERRSVVPLIRDLHERSEQIRVAELQRARKMLARGDDPGAVLEALSNGLLAKYMHSPQQALRGARGAQRDMLCSLLPRLFRGGAHP